MAYDTPESLLRAQRDLEIVQHALPDGYPFDQSTVAAWLGLAAVSALGVVAAATTSNTLGAMTLSCAVVLVVGVMILTLKVRQARARVPFAWREVKRVSIAKLTAGPPLLAFAVWQLLQGASGQLLISTTAFWGGAIAIMYATTRPWRRVGFGIGLPLLILGGIAPVIGTQHLAIAAALTGLVAGVSCASIIIMQMRSRTQQSMR